MDLISRLDTIPACDGRYIITLPHLDRHANKINIIETQNESGGKVKNLLTVS